MTNTGTAKKYDLVEDAGRKFAADVEKIVTQYREAVDKAITDKNEVIDKAERVKREAEEQFTKVRSAEMNKCEERINQAAKIRAEKAEHPEDIAAVCLRYTTPLANGSGATFAPSCVLDWLEWQRQTAIDSDEAKKQQEMKRTRAQRTHKPWQGVR